MEDSTEKLFVEFQHSIDNSVKIFRSIVEKLLQEVELLKDLELLKKTFSEDYQFFFDSGKALLNGKGSLIEEVNNFEIQLIRAALVKAKGSQVEAAKLLQIKKTTLHEKIKRHNLGKQTSVDYKLEN